MKITGFNPQVISKDPDSVIAVFEALGFQRTHNKTSEKGVVFSSVRMKDANGFHVDIIKAENVPGDRDLSSIRINVDDFDEAFKFFMDKGFRESQKFGRNDTPSSKYSILISPSGFLIDLVQHIK